MIEIEQIVTIDNCPALHVKSKCRLPALVAECMERGYNILVTGDHGMNADWLHGGTTPDVREVPLYLIRPDMAGKGDTKEVISQLQIAPTICKLLDIAIPGTMKQAPVV